ncbi:MAG TPA: asparaginase [Actinomycetota bacterium]|nr:asparaginase [Actinomycetota bacterium]
MPRAEPIVRVIRSGLEESVHLGHVAVADADGRLVARLGDPFHEVFLRSATKPLQAAVSLSLIDQELPERLIAALCGSHNGEPVHVAAARAILRSGGLRVSALRCPPALPLDRAAMRAARRPRPVFHNCSAKHAGMAVASARAGLDVLTYPEPSHPLQRRILRAVRRGSGVERPRIGVDGCGVPVHGVPLVAAATLYARLLAPERFGRLGGPVERAVRAMRAHPYLVAGRGRTDTAVMQQVPGSVVKVGAEALHCAAVPALGLGVAVKVADGGERASGPALIHVLRLLGAIDDAQLERLGRHAGRPVTGGGRLVGEVVPAFSLRTG